jgi:hypothetical protein
MRSPSRAGRPGLVVVEGPLLQPAIKAVASINMVIVLCITEPGA